MADCRLAVALASLLTVGLGCRSQSPDTVPGPGASVAGAQASNGLSATGPSPLSASAVAGSSGSEPRPGDEPASTDGGAPRPEPFDLTRLREFRDKRMSSAQRLEGLLKLLREQMHNPCLPALSGGTGPIDTWYAQGAIIRALGARVAPEDLRAAREREIDQPMRDRLTVAMGIAGDPAVVPELIRVLSHDPQGFLREGAALALRNLRVAAAKDALHAALDDRYSVVRSDDVWGIHKEYPVRNVAGEALRVLGEKVGYDSYADLRRAKDHAQALSWLLEDRVPLVCLSTVQVLGQQGAHGLPYLKKFVDETAGDDTLKEAIQAAKAIIEAEEAQAAPPPKP
jgi:hypothetical protein